MNTTRPLICAVCAILICCPVPLGHGQAPPLRAQQSVNPSAAMSEPEQVRRIITAASINGLLVVLDVQAGMGPDQQGVARIVAIGSTGAVRRGNTPRVLARMPVASVSGLAPSPRGRYVAYAVNAPEAAGPARQKPGIWLARAGGGSPVFAVAPPSPVAGAAIASLAWSSDRYTLAYAVGIAGEGSPALQSQHALGLWLTDYQGGRPHELISNASLGVTSASITRVDWTPDRRAIIVSTALPGAGGNVPAVLSVDAVSGRVHTLLRAGQDAAVNPATGALAYTTTTPHGTTLWVADAHGSHPRRVTAVSPGSPVWSPDGHLLGYLDHLSDSAATTIRVVDLATGRLHSVVADDAPGQTALLVHGHFYALAWLHIPA